MSKPQAKIGLFGGTFNPIHCGHIKATELVAERFTLDKVYFIPSYIPPHKESVHIASPMHRLRMVELAVASQSRLSPSSVEIDAGGKSYSILTLQKMKALYPESKILFMLGVDAFLEIETWKDYKRVLEQCSFIIMSRPGFHMEDANKVLSRKHRHKIMDLSKSDGPGKIESLVNMIYLFPIQAMDLSSTEVRTRVRENQSIKGLVPEPVERYIKENGLYKKNE